MNNTQHNRPYCLSRNSCMRKAHGEGEHEWVWGLWSPRERVTKDSREKNESKKAKRRTPDVARLCAFEFGFEELHLAPEGGAGGYSTASGRISSVHCPSPGWRTGAFPL